MKLRPVGSNQTELTIKGSIILFSYQTPVAVIGIGGNYKTDKWFSQTTTRHINSFFKGLETPKEIPNYAIVNYIDHIDPNLNYPKFDKEYWESVI